MTLNQTRLVRLNDQPIAKSGQFVLYWMQTQRRLSHNHSLDYALKCANDLGKPLVIYEGLRLDYPWASARLHQFILEGMKDNAALAKKLGFTYWPYVETPKQPRLSVGLKMAGSPVAAIAASASASVRQAWKAGCVSPARATRSRRRGESRSPSVHSRRRRPSRPRASIRRGRRA